VAAEKLLILGTRMFALEVADLATDAGFEISGFVENLDRKRCAEPLEGLPVHWIGDVAAFTDTHLAVCALGTTHRHRFIEQAAQLGFRFATVVHPSARISTRSSVGEGTIVSSGAVIAAYSTIGRHVVVNRGALIGHHTQIADYVSIQPGANVAGACRIGERAYIAMAAVVIDHVTVGSHSVVGAGAVVTKDVPSNVQVVGIPARIVKEKVEGK
jgi:sugar O-acyltransferase, sialic acid O-acetyltransferase NeuD family